MASRSSSCRAASPNITDPIGVAVDSSDNIYVADPGSDTIFRFDPSGATALRAAKRMRRHALLTGGRRDEERIRETAEEHFGVQPSGLGYWEKLDVKPPWGTNGRGR